MESSHHRALMIHSSSNGVPQVRMESVHASDLPDGEVTVAVRYSSINYKDALAITGRGRIIRGDLPFVPGIDLAGEVVDSKHSRFAVGDRVVGTGGGLGETIWGGYAEAARPNPDYLVHIPESFSYEQSMAIGTAGFTAMLSVMALDDGAVDKAMPVLVTGASGGVGSAAVALLARNGYEVDASTGKTNAREYLQSLGAKTILHRRELSDGASRPLDSATWSGAVDTVGGQTLAGLISRLGWRGTVAACGNAGGADLNTTVFPFILRGIRMIGIDSNQSPIAERTRAWERLRDEMPEDLLATMYRVVDLDDVVEVCTSVIQGSVRGRIVVRVND